MKSLVQPTMIFVALLTGLSKADAGIVLIDFNDGAFGDPVSAFYNSFGITFSNGEWSDSSSHAGSSSPLGIYSQNNPFGSVIPPSAPVVGVFDQPVSDVGIIALDVGVDGARIEAFDAPIGGNMIGFDEFFGTGPGVGNFGQLSVGTSGIRRIEFFQPLGGTGSGDGVNFDDLSFTVVPEPSSAILFLVVFGVLVVNNRSQTRRSKTVI